MGKHVYSSHKKMVANTLESYYTTHPGEVLKDEVEYRGISQKELAEKMGMPYKSLNDILNERRPLTTETAMLFEAALGINAQTLLAMQMDYNIAQAKKNKTFLSRLMSIKRVAAVF